MPALVGFLSITLILILLMTQRVSPVVALGGVPIVAAFVLGNSPTEVGGFITEGLGGVVGIVAMFVFAIIFFGILRDAGTFDPVINRIVKWGSKGPVAVTLATTALGLVAHLDGSGATTFLIAVPAMLPLYDKLGMSRLVLATCVGLAAGVMNLTPWAGPTARAAATLGVDANELWLPLLPAQIAGIFFVLVIAYILGRKEAKRLRRLADGDVTAEVEESTGRANGQGVSNQPTTDSDLEPGQVQTRKDVEIEDSEQLLRPKLLWVNGVLLLATLVALIMGISPALCFIVATVIALLLNYPGLSAQTARIDAHAKAAMLMASTLLAAGVLLGTLEGSGMIEAMASSIAGLIPEGAGGVLPLAVGALGVPLSLLFGPDAYYFGVLPVLVSVGEGLGVDPLMLGHASLIGQETVGFPISPLTGSFYLLVGLANVSIGRHIRHLFGWAWLLSLGMLAVAVLTGVITVGMA